MIGLVFGCFLVAWLGIAHLGVLVALGVTIISGLMLRASVEWLSAIVLIDTLWLWMSGAAFLGVVCLANRGRMHSCLRIGLLKRSNGLLVGGALIVVTCMAMACWLWSAAAIGSGDELHIWNTRGRIMAAQSHMNGDLGAHLRGSHQESVVVAHADYPTFVSLLHSWSSRRATAIGDYRQRWPVQIFDFACLLITLGLAWAASLPVSAKLLMLSPFLMKSYWLMDGAADRVMCGLVIVVLISMFLRNNFPCTLWRPLDYLCGWGLIGIAWGKNEGWLYVVAFVLACVVGRLTRSIVLSWRQVFLVCAPAIFVICLHIAWNMSLDLNNDIVGRSDGQSLLARFIGNLGRVKLLCGWWIDGVAFSGEWTGGLWVVASLLTIIAIMLRQARAICGPATWLIASSAGLMTAFVLSPHDIAWHWDTAGSRVFAHLNGALVVMCCVAVPSCRSANVRD